MTNPFRVACLQVNAGPDIAPNLAVALDLARRARDGGADLILMPECVTAINFGRDATLAAARTEADHPALAAFRDLARDTGAWIHGGSLTVRLPGEDRVANRTYMIDPTGAVIARYDKIHMFDVDLDGGESYRESKLYKPGDRAAVVDTPWGRLGLSICYDLRFPHLYRALAHAGARFLAVPAAFTRQTGRAHWHVLLRARAIETGCYVFAPAQCGTHVQGRETFGHALIVDPWGQVLADAGEDVGVISATIDPAAVDTARGRIPALTHDVAFEGP
ncbi:MAG: carbon-nitrogen hydrolase family protein [Rhodobacterales bacterium]|nr:carbon-nitrogen hydrolase family protein [Rhodobacterales bacterium]